MWLSGLYNSRVDSRFSIEEFRDVFDEMFPELCVYAIKFVSDFDTSKDIVQDVFTGFWEENHKLRNKNMVRSYLYKAVKNRALNHNKRESCKTGLDDFFDHFHQSLEDSGAQSIESMLSFYDLQNDLEKAIAELPEQRQKIFRMSRFEQLKHKEIAIKLSISPKTVETQIYRSLNFLREKLQHYL